MRYLDWDVLLFPAESKVPLQEFKTACFVAQEPVNPIHIYTAGLPSTRYPIDHAVPRPLPIIASFVPNLPCDSPFRVSVHSWHPPTASRFTLAMAPQEDMVYFEARVLIDGNCVAKRMFKNAELCWPQVIDTCAQVDKNGKQADLKFPPFHQETLNQTWWDAGEDMGRIRVTIAEGIGHSETVFQNIKTVVAFSFQHAPLGHLETVGIAWPNPGMWYPNPQAMFNATSPRKGNASDPDGHAHSPRRHGVANSDRDRRPSSEMLPPCHLSPRPNVSRSMGPPLLPGQRPFLDSNSWSSLPPMPDPFMTSYKPRSGRSSSYGETMPDYLYSTTSASSRNVSHEVASEMAWSVAGSSQHDIEDRAHGLQPAYSPPTMTGAVRLHNGWFVPANTRVNSAANTPPIEKRPSAAAMARASSDSHSKNCSVSVTAEDPTLPQMKQPWRANDLADRKKPFGAFSGEESIPKIDIKPADFIRSRKEGNSSESRSLPQPLKVLRGESSQLCINERASEGKENATSDSKRKRVVSAPGQRFFIDDRGPPDSSPTRSVSKITKVRISSAPSKHIEQEEPLVDDLTEEGIVVRQALGEVHKIQ